MNAVTPISPPTRPNEALTLFCRLLHQWGAYVDAWDDPHRFIGMSDDDAEAAGNAADNEATLFARAVIATDAQSLELWAVKALVFLNWYATGSEWFTPEATAKALQREGFAIMRRIMSAIDKRPKATGRAAVGLAASHNLADTAEADNAREAFERRIMAARAADAGDVFLQAVLACSRLEIFDPRVTDRRANAYRRVSYDRIRSALLSIAGHAYREGVPERTARLARFYLSEAARRSIGLPVGEREGSANA